MISPARLLQSRASTVVTENGMEFEIRRALSPTLKQCVSKQMYYLLRIEQDYGSFDREVRMHNDNALIPKIVVSGPLVSETGERMVYCVYEGIWDDTLDTFLINNSINLAELPTFMCPVPVIQKFLNRIKTLEMKNLIYTNLVPSQILVRLEYNRISKLAIVNHRYLQPESSITVDDEIMYENLANADKTLQRLFVNWETLRNGDMFHIVHEKLYSLIEIKPTTLSELNIDQLLYKMSAFDLSPRRKTVNKSDIERRKLKKRIKHLWEQQDAIRQAEMDKITQEIEKINQQQSMDMRQQTVELKKKRKAYAKKVAEQQAAEQRRQEKAQAEEETSRRKQEYEEEWRREMYEEYLNAEEAKRRKNEEESQAQQERERQTEADRERRRAQSAEYARTIAEIRSLSEGPRHDEDTVLARRKGAPWIFRRWVNEVIK